MQKSRIEMMRAYAETMRCRRQFLLQYFGEVDPRPCGDCDNCHAGRRQTNRSWLAPSRSSRECSTTVSDLEW
jgi:ATP-dependent DNA helicase RecQ